jgi:transposase-like protein
MTTLILKCPHCGEGNEVSTQAVVIRCGVVFCRCVCRACSQEFEDQQEYWQWLGLAEAPPAELEG